MLAAIYARKSTEQLVADEQKSVARQVAHAREYAARKGWHVEEAERWLAPILNYTPKPAQDAAA